MTGDAVTEATWSDWRKLTPARLALGRVGTGMPTEEVLRFGWAHARARDAIHAALDVATLEAALQKQGWQTIQLRSHAADRISYLRRPDLGRRLAPDSAAQLHALKLPPCDVTIVIGDGLSSLAVQRHAPPLLAALRPLQPLLAALRPLLPDLAFGPLVIATQARVALADEIAELTRARIAAMLIGERPGLSSPDSLGIYLTHAPFRGRSDADRNCISNVRPEGLSYPSAAFRLAWLIRAALDRGRTGVTLKDDSDHALTKISAPLPRLPGEA